MTSQATVDDFLAQEKLAIVGVSRKRMKFGSIVYRELAKRGYQAYGVNPSLDTIEGQPCYSDLGSLPEKVDGAVLVVPRQVTERVVEDAVRVSVSRIWMQQGSESPTAIRKCEEHGIRVVHGECILMFAEPVTSIHRVHRWLWRLLGKLPK
jgi:predicted CoA-binding protein